jgi:hypothetical protein
MLSPWRVAAEQDTTTYHVTTRPGLEEIKKHGLQPQIGLRSQDLGEADSGTYVFPSREHMDTALGSWLGEQFDDDESLHGLTVQTPSSWVEGSPNSYERVIRRPVPPHMITSVEDLDEYRGTPINSRPLHQASFTPWRVAARRRNMRRIVTAREQYDMLAPWREAASSPWTDSEGRYTGPARVKAKPYRDSYSEDESGNCVSCGVHFSQPHVGPHEAAAAARHAGVGDEVFEHLKKSPGGITFKHHPGDKGDVSVNDTGSRGYMVSLPHAEKKQDFATMTPKDVDDYYHDHPEIQEPGNSYGGWNEDREVPEPPGSDWYHDVSQNVHDSYDATGKALDWKQKAIFDNDKHDHRGEPLDSAYPRTTDLASSGPASALGWTQAKRRMPG